MKFEVKTEHRNGVERYRINLRSIGQGRLFFTDRERAEEKLTEIQNNGLAAASLPLADRMALIEAKEKLEPLGATIREAVEFYVSHHKAKEDKPLIEALAVMLDDKTKNRRRERYVRQLKYDIGAFLRSLNVTLCREITPEHVSGWLHGNGWQPKTIDGKFIALQTFFSYALRKGWMLTNPCSTLERITVDYKKPGILTVAQAELLMRAAEIHSTEKRLIPYLALALFAGVRPNEVMRLKWDDVSNGVLRIESEQSKIRHHRLVHLSKNCRAWLKLGGDLPPVNWQDSLALVRKAAGFEYSTREKLKGKTSIMVPGIRWPHDCLRHSYVSYSLPIHGVAHTAREAGHSETILHDDYKELVSKIEAKKFWEIMPATDK